MTHPIADAGAKATELVMRARRVGLSTVGLKYSTLEELEEIVKEKERQVLGFEVPPEPPAPTKRGVLIAALWINRLTYGQIEKLTGASKSAVADAVARFVPEHVKEMRGRAHGGPLIPYTEATALWAASLKAPPHKNAVQLAAWIKQRAVVETDTMDGEETDV